MLKRLDNRAAALAFAGVALAGCTHSVDLVPLEGGRPGIGDVSVGGSALTVYYEGERYAGRIVPAEDPALARLATPLGATPAGRRFGIQNEQGRQGAVLAAKSGASIACRFNYDHPTSIGSGVCRSDRGQNFALRMR